MNSTTDVELHSVERERGLVPLTIDGTQRWLRFDNFAIRKLLTKLELSGIDAVGRILKGLDPWTLQVCVWAGLLHDDPKLEVEWLDHVMYSQVEAAAAATFALELAIWGPKAMPPEEDGGSDDEPDPLQRRATRTKRGASSSGSRAGRSASRKKKSGRSRRTS